MSSTLRPEVILQGGHVIDPLHGHNGAMDVAIGGGTIAAVGLTRT
jgi:predicted amidohydrolase